MPEIHLRGNIYSELNEVDSVHIGMVYHAFTDREDIACREKDKLTGGWFTVSEMREVRRNGHMESWSTMCFDALLDVLMDVLLNVPVGALMDVPMDMPTEIYDLLTNLAVGIDVFVREKGFYRFQTETLALFKVVGIADLAVWKTCRKGFAEIASSTVKKTLTGSGRAGKGEVAAA